MSGSELDKIRDMYMNDEADAWHPDHEFGKSLGCPIISQAAPALMEEPDWDTFLWRLFIQVCKEAYGDDWIYHCQFQKRGTCGGQGAKNAWDMTTTNLCAMYAQKFPGRASVAGMYAGSRVEIAHNPARNPNNEREDGTYGGHIAQLLAKYGPVLLKSLNELGCTENYYIEQGMDKDEQLAIKWAASREGIPANFENHIFGTGGIIKPRSAREAGKIIQQGIALITGNNLIPTGRRDKAGFSPVQQAGGHLTAYIGVRYNPFGLCYLQSWGDEFAEGPVYVPDQPVGTVWITEAEADAQIRQDDTWGIGNIQALDDKFLSAFAQPK